MLDTLIIDDFIDIMEQYFHYYNQNEIKLLLFIHKKLNSIFDTESKNIYFIAKQ